MPRPKSEPTYYLHRATGQARTIINRKTHYLGAYNSPESQKRFDELLAEWRRERTVDQFTITIDDLALKFLDHAQSYYLAKDGTPTGTAENFKYALRPLIKKHGMTRVKDFDVLALEEVRDAMIQSGRARNYINGSIAKIKQVFRWGKNKKLVPPQIYDAIRDLDGLRAGRSKARETKPVAPVDEGTINDTLPHLTRVVADMVRLQLLCGARPGEICAIRPRDITRGTTGVWVYRPASHKTEHHGKERRIPIGPEGQRVLARYLDRDPDAYCFSPIEAEAERNAIRKANRRTPMTPSQKERTTLGRKLGQRYTKRTYHRAVQRACEIAFGMPSELRNVTRTVKRMKIASDAERAATRVRLNRQAANWWADFGWAPNQLRHTRATAIREKYGIEAAQNVLGHADPKITLVYAERDFQTAVRIMKEIG